MRRHGNYLLRVWKMNRDCRIKEVGEAVGALIEPLLKWTVADLQLLRNIEIKDNILQLHIELISADVEQKRLFCRQLLAVLAEFQFAAIELKLTSVESGGNGIEGVKNIFLVGSGKGGVGKSSIAVNLAVTLQQRGFRVGLIDADIHGPSVPLLTGITDRKPKVLSDEVLQPVTEHGIKILSIGNLVTKQQAIPWRGVMVSGTILQFIRKTEWGRLDFLIIDMPPGTGDIHITIASELKATGAVIVTMPQEVVIGDVIRSIQYLKEKKTPIVGIVNNMTSYCCEKCGHEQVIFSGKSLHEYGVEQLAEIPLSREFCTSGNDGIPYMVNSHDGVIAREFERLADHLIAFAKESMKKE